MKKSKLFGSAVLCGTLILSGCSGGPQDELNVKDEKNEEVVEGQNSIENRKVTKETFTSEYVPISYANGYLLGADGIGNNNVSVVLNTEGELLYKNDYGEDLTSVVNSIAENKKETYFRTGANGKVGLLDTDFEKAYEGSEFINTAGNGFYGYKDGKPCYMDSNFKVKKTFDDFYNMLWNDQYLIKGGAYSQNTTYDYDKTRSSFGTTYPRIYDCSTSEYKAENDYGEIYDLDENLLVRLDSASVPYTWANYVLLGENMLLEQPGSENTEHQDMASVRILDFDLKEQVKIAGAYDHAYFSEPGLLYIVLEAGEPAAISRKGTLTENLNPGKYLYDIKERKILNDISYPRLSKIHKIGTEEEPMYEFLDDIGNRIIDYPILDYMRLENTPIFVVQRNDGKCALVDQHGEVWEDFSNAFSIVQSQYDEKILYYDGREVDIDDIRYDFSNAYDKGYFMFSIKSDEYRETMSTEPMQYDSVVYILE